MKKTIIAVLMTLICAALFAQNAASDFEISERGTITKYKGWDSAVVIPETINGVRVTAIGNGAFASNDLTSVTIPNGVTGIGDEAFSGNKLTSVTIPASVTYIGQNAFGGNQLTSVTIPGNGVTINSRAFNNNKLTSVTIPGNEAFIDGTQAFANNPITSITLGKNHVLSTDILSNNRSLYYDYACNDRKAGTYTANRAVAAEKTEGDFKYIETQYGAFITKYTGNAGNRLEIPSRLGGISVKAIRGFSGISRVRIPDSVTYIGDGAFKGNQLTEITIPNNVNYIGNEAFSGNKLTSVTIPDSVIFIGNNAFFRNQLASVTIGSGVTYIGAGVFSRNELTSVTIPDNTFIGQNAFSNNRLTSVTIGSGVIAHSRPFDAAGGFEKIYDANGRTAATYTRLDTESTNWTKQ